MLKYGGIKYDTTNESTNQPVDRKLFPNYSIQLHISITIK